MSDALTEESVNRTAEIVFSHLDGEWHAQATEDATGEWHWKSDTFALTRYLNAFYF